jgi:hypothetical protein
VPAPKELAKLSDEARRWLESLTRKFDESWQEGQLVTWAAKLPSGNPLRQRALAELIKIDISRSWRLGKPALLE